MAEKNTNKTFRAKYLVTFSVPAKSLTEASDKADIYLETYIKEDKKFSKVIYEYPEHGE